MQSNYRPSSGLRINISIVCVLVAVLAAYHPIAGAQQADGAVSPAVPPDDVAKLAERKLKLDYAATPIALRIALPPADVASKRSEAEARGDRPLQIGFARTMPSKFRGDLSPLIDWTPLGDGSIVGALSVTSPEALAIRAGIHAELGSGGEIRFFGRYTAMGYTEQGRANLDLPVITQEDFPEGEKPELLWSPTVEGDTIGIEITLPSQEALSAFSLSIERLSHIYVPIGSLGYMLKRLDCNNHIDVQCPDRISPQSGEDAVALISYVKSGNSYICSGTLIRNRFFSPLFLTANHCVSTGTVARTVDAWWFYQATSCGSPKIDRRFARTNSGTLLLETSVAQDSTLLRFRRRLPGGLFYSGWFSGALNHKSKVYGIHHPDGGIKKYSEGKITGQRNQRICQDPRNEIGCFTLQNAISVDWSKGTTEGGSSGSGLFDPGTKLPQVLIGVLSGGSGACETRIAYYGPFADFHPKISHWLSHDHLRSSALPLVMSASNAVGQGLVRIINRSDVDGSVEIQAIDDVGGSPTPIRLSLDAYEAVQLNSKDLERDTGSGIGDWRLELTSDVNIAPFAYIQTPDGVVTSIHQVAAKSHGEKSNGLLVPFFNPGSDTKQRSFLRMINPIDINVNVQIYGRDDWGSRSLDVHVTLKAREACTVSSQELESGQGSADPFSSCQNAPTGKLGNGRGKWRLIVVPDHPIQVMGLLLSPTGVLTNLSR